MFYNCFTTHVPNAVENLFLAAENNTLPGLNGVQLYDTAARVSQRLGYPQRTQRYRSGAIAYYYEDAARNALYDVLISPEGVVMTLTLYQRPPIFDEIPIVANEEGYKKFDYADGRQLLIWAAHDSTVVELFSLDDSQESFYNVHPTQPTYK